MLGFLTRLLFSDRATGAAQDLGVREGNGRYAKVHFKLFAPPPHPPRPSVPPRVPSWLPLCTYARGVSCGSGQVGDAAEPLGQNELKDTDQDSLLV